MAIERTLSIIKPDATKRNITGLINAKLESVGLRIIAQKMICMSQSQAEQFYIVHKNRPFYSELISVMIAGSVIVQVLEGENAVSKNREVMGATDPEKSEIGTIRREFGLDISHNSVHGSDSIENAKDEIAFFFKEDEIFK